MATNDVRTHTSPARGPASGRLARRLIWGSVAAFGASGAFAAVLSGFSAWMAYQAARPRGVWGNGEPPEGAAEDVQFPSATDGTRIRGWLLRTEDPQPIGSVILCHGAWTGRRECLPLALRFREAGYNVLVFDFRAHGLSEGRYITVGHEEMKDVLGAVEFLKARPRIGAKRIGVVGFSMGAAAAINAAARTRDIAAVVADSSYASFLDAMKYSFHHVRHVPHFPFGTMAVKWAQWIVKVDPTQLRPVDAIGRIAPRPILVIHGQEDDVVPVNHAYLLYKAAGEPKDLWIVPEAKHVWARDMYPDEYFRRVEPFLRSALTGAGITRIPRLYAA
jgi:fermentation-respiration switch protein FrsA (DUF1100 family)